jgi:hypothetical protein
MTRFMTALATAGLLTGSFTAWANETAGEKVDETVNTGKSTAQKGANRISEAACPSSQADCNKQKAKNRAQETKNDTANKSKELKDQAD